MCFLNNPPVFCIWEQLLSNNKSNFNFRIKKNSFLVGVMTELLDLMSETNRSSGSSASQPQHPSDLTRRYTASAVSKALLASFWLSNRLIWCLLVGTTKDAWHTRSRQWPSGSGSSTTASRGSALPMSQITFEVILVISDCQIMLLLCNLPKHCFFHVWCCCCCCCLNIVVSFNVHVNWIMFWWFFCI